LQIRLNGDAHELAAPLSITALLATLSIDPRRVAVEHNLVVIRREAYDSTIVSDGDEVEIVNFVGGGDHALDCDAGRLRAGKILDDF
jgi:thiazole synthase